MLGLRGLLLQHPLAVLDLVAADRLEDVDTGLRHLIQLALDSLLAPAVELVSIQLPADVALAVLADPLEVLDDVVAQPLGEQVGLHSLLEDEVRLLALGLGPDDAVAVLQLLVGPVVHVLGLALPVVPPDGGNVPADLALVHGGRLAALGALGAVLAGVVVDGLADLLGAGVVLDVLVALGLVVLAGLGLISSSEVVPAVPQGVDLSGNGHGSLHHLLSQPGLLSIVLADSVLNVNLHHVVYTLLL